MKDSLERVVVWRSLIAEGTDYCALWRTSAGWRLKGTAISAARGSAAMVARYEVHCDEGWRTRRVEIEVIHARQTRTLELTVDDSGRWLAERELPEVAGCIDVDLAITPATNTLPIRRLNIPAGESREMTAAWIKFPGLECERLPQRYTRLSSDTYRYESGNFVSEIIVDELGLVISYKDAWERVSGQAFEDD